MNQDWAPQSFVSLWLSRTKEMDVSVLNFISYMLLFWGVIVLVSLQFVSAPYGRYSRAGWGVQLNGKLAWFLQEIPSLLVPGVIVLYTDCPKLSEIPNKILLGCFLLHYFQRYIRLRSVM